MAARNCQVSDLPRRRGLTLLELILALSLSVVLLFAVGLALRLYWRAFDVKRTNVEQSHLARAILQHIDRDLRSAVQSTPVDLSGLESMTNSSSLAGAFAGMTGAGSPAATAAGTSGATGGSATGGTTGGASGGTSAQTPTTQGSGSSSGGAASSSSTKTGTSSTQSSGATGGSSTSGSGTSTSGQPATGEATEETTTAATPAAVVGLYGSANQLQFDVSRIPRVDEYAGGSPTSMVQIPSDIKTLTYYVRGESGGDGSSAAGSSEPSTTGQGRGLMRLEMDRAVSAYSESNGSLSANYDNAKLMADEVTSITFRYWNGTEWATDWNSDDMGGLPLAIEVVMTMADPNAVESTDPTAQNFGTGETSTDTSYRIVVNIPTASLPPPAEEPATEGEAAATGTGATGTGTTGSGAPASSSTTTGGSSGS